MKEFFKNKEIYSILFIYIVSISFFKQSINMKADAGLFPKLLSIIIFILNTLYLFNALKKKVKLDKLKEEISIKNKILSELNQNGYEDISTIEDICKNDKKKKSVLDSMIGAEIELLDDENIIATELYEKAKEKLIDYINKNGEISLGEFRDMMNSSRKISMFILESFDKKKITKRVENKRILY